MKEPDYSILTFVVKVDGWAIATITTFDKPNERSAELAVIDALRGYYGDTADITLHLKGAVA